LTVAVQAKARPVVSGARSGAQLALASAVSIVANYVFLLAAGRTLGSDDYGTLAALLGVLAVVLIPAGALQMAVSREISRRLASGDAEGAQAFTRAVLRLSGKATIPLVVVALALALPLNDLLNIHSVGIVVLANTTLATALVSPVAIGVIQGSQRFRALAVTYVAPVVLRLAFFGVLAAAGLRLGGAVLASVLGGLAGTALAFWLIRGQLGGTRVSTWDRREFLRYLGPVAIGLIGIALLTHIDLLIVKARFSGNDAGAYAAASAFARVGFFLPAMILTVLFPRTAARQARGEQTDDILGRSLLATAAFCGGLAVFYAATGVGIVSMSFGRDFAEGGRVLAPFALAIGLFSLANVLVGYHLSRGETRYAWIVAGSVLVQVAVLSIFPTGLHGIVWANVGIGAALVVAHELFVSSSVPALRAGLHRAAVATASVRKALPEAILALLAGTIFVCALFSHVVVHAASTVIGRPGSDSTGTMFWLWQLQHESGFHLLGITHHTLSGAPFGWDEGNGLNLQWLLPYYPGYLAARLFGEVTALNLVVLSGYVLSGVVMYLLVRYLRCSRPVAAWAAVAFVVFPWHLARAEHASLVHIEVLAILVLALVGAAKRPTWLRFGFVGAAALACWLTSGYYGAMAVVTGGAFALGAALASPRGRRLLLVGGTAAAVVGASLLIAIGSYSSGVNRGAGLNRDATDLSIFGLHPQQVLVPAEDNLVLGDRLKSFHDTHVHLGNTTEGATYLGLLTIGLALAWLVIAWRRRTALPPGMRAATAGLTAAFIAGLFFAAPSPVHVFGHSLPMPARLLWAVVPAFRVNARWLALLMTVVLPLAALGLQAASTRLRARKSLALGVVGLAIVFSFFELTSTPAKARFRTSEVSPAYSAVERTPPGILAEYPLGSADLYRLAQRSHGRRLLNGAPAGTEADEARLVLLDPATPGTAEALAFLGVTAIVIHPHAIVDAEVAPRPPVAGGGFRLVGRFPEDTSVWQVTAKPAPALVTLPGGFAPPKLEADHTVGYALVESGGVAPLEVISTVDQLIRLTFTATPPRQARLRVAGAAQEQPFALDGPTQVSVLVQVPRGRSQLLLKTDPAPTSEADAIVISTPRAERATGQAVLRADPLTSDPGF
jgi:O-antigen/teichoic acid export membrane protein